MCAGVTAFSTGVVLPRVTGSDTAHGNCQWRLLWRKSSSFLRGLCYCTCTRDTACRCNSFLVWENSNAPACRGSHPLATRCHVRMLPQGSGSQELEHGQWLQQRCTCLCLVNNWQGLHICDTTAFVFQGIVSKKYDWCLVFFPSVVRFSVPYC